MMSLPDSANERKELPMNQSNISLSSYTCSCKTLLRTLEDVGKHKIHWRDHDHLKDCPHLGCVARFTQVSNAQRHWESKHLPDCLRTRWRCGKCQVHYVKKRDFVRHLERQDCTFNRVKVPIPMKERDSTRRSSCRDFASHGDDRIVGSTAFVTARTTEEPTTTGAGLLGGVDRVYDHRNGMINNSDRAGHEVQADVPSYNDTIVQDHSNDIARYLYEQLLEDLSEANSNHRPDVPESDSFDSILFGETRVDQEVPKPLSIPGEFNAPSYSLSVESCASETSEDSFDQDTPASQFIPVEVTWPQPHYTNATFGESKAHRSSEASKSACPRFHRSPFRRLWENLKSTRFGNTRQSDDEAVNPPEQRTTTRQRLVHGLQRLRRLVKM